MLTAVIHISDIHFLHDIDTDGVYIENENILEIGLFFSIILFDNQCRVFVCVRSISCS